MKQETEDAGSTRSAREKKRKHLSAIPGGRGLGSVGKSSCISADEKKAGGGQLNDVVGAVSRGGGKTAVEKSRVCFLKQEKRFVGDGKRA